MLRIDEQDIKKVMGQDLEEEVDDQTINEEVLEGKKGQDDEEVDIKSELKGIDFEVEEYRPQVSQEFRIVNHYTKLNYLFGSFSFQLYIFQGILICILIVFFYNTTLSFLLYKLYKLCKLYDTLSLSLLEIKNYTSYTNYKSGK